MRSLDWFVLISTLAFIVIYGIWKSRKNKDIEGYLLGGRSMTWWTIGLSVMATQASAITFLSTPGMAFEEGMGFIQFYFAMPIAMILICLFVIPLYHKLNIYTAYEFLETRFDLKTRWLTSFLFMINRGLSAGMTIYAPSIILSTIMGWDLLITNLIIGGLVILYTVSGGVKAVGQTHKLQMGVMIGGLVTVLILLFNYLAPDVSPKEAVVLAGKMGKMQIVDTEFDPGTKYNLWSGLIGGLFLFLSYFGTDQSQVQRYISGKDQREMKLGLLFNGIFKIPMQMLILFIGVMCFMFFQFNQGPSFFNENELAKIESVEGKAALNNILSSDTKIFIEKENALQKMRRAYQENNESLMNDLTIIVRDLDLQLKTNKEQIRALIKAEDADAETNDADYMFIYFILNYLPAGLIGLLLAVIFSGAMSSTSAELSALSSTTLVDVYKRKVKPEASDEHYLKRSKLFTLGWGILALLFANMFNLFDNLIELVNIIGSLFYGTILGIFLVAFLIPFVKRKAIFIAGVISEVLVLGIYFLSNNELCTKYLGRSNPIELEYLWLNLVGPILVITLSMIIQIALGNKSE